MGAAAVLMRSGTTEDNRLHFRFPQEKAIESGVLVASHWWRKPYLEAIQVFAEENDCELVSIGQLIAEGELTVTDGHGSPSSHFHGRGDVPYIKVVDIKNWRINENPSYQIPVAEAKRLRRTKTLKAWDLVTPTRASRNIGLFSVVMPWQTDVILTREITVWRVQPAAKLLSPWLLLELMSLRVVHDQFNFAVLMQMNREDLGKRFREVVLPIPRTGNVRRAWGAPIERYLKAQEAARTSYTELGELLAPELFADRP